MAEADTVSALSAYLEWLLQERRNLPLRAVSTAKIDGQARPPELSRVYINLNTRDARGERQAGREATGEEKEPVPVLEAVAANQRLVLLGDPGTGKSTFVSHLAYCRAGRKKPPGHRYRLESNLNTLRPTPGRPYHRHQQRRK